MRNSIKVMSVAVPSVAIVETNSTRCFIMQPSRLSVSLKAALLSNASFSSLCGVALVLCPAAIAAWVGTGWPLVYQGVGIGLLAFAALIVVVVRRRPIDTFWALLISIADLGWVLGTGVILATAWDWFSPAGRVAITVVALFVMTFAIAQVLGMRRVSHSREHLEKA